MSSKPGSGAATPSSTAVAPPSSNGGSAAPSRTSTPVNRGAAQAATLGSKAGAPAQPQPNAGQGKAAPPNAWTARSLKAAKEREAAAAAAATGSAPASSAASSAAAPATTKAPAGSAHAAKPATPAAANAAPSSQKNAPAPASAPTQDLATLLGKPLKVTTTTGVVAQGLLWCFDDFTGSVVLETRSAAAAAATKLVPLMASLDLSGTPYSTTLPPQARRTDASTPRSSFRILKARDVQSVEVLSLSEASALGLPAALSTIEPAITEPAAAEARVKAALEEVNAKSLRIGKGVGSLGQSIFDALSKTLPCRWHEQHIIVMDEIIIHGPHYDAERTVVPRFTHEQLRALAEGSNTNVSLPAGTTFAEAKARANSWTRIVKVLEGERKKILTKQGAVPPT